MEVDYKLKSAELTQDLNDLTEMLNTTIDERDNIANDRNRLRAIVA